MPQRTTHFELEKPTVTEAADISVINNNMDDIDTILYENQQMCLAALENIADDYDAVRTYSVGDLVTYQGKLYKCVVAIDTARAWDSTDWAATTIVAELLSRI